MRTISLGNKEKTTEPPPTEDELSEARETAFAAVTEWFHLCLKAGKTVPEIMRELGGMMRK